MNRPVLHVAVHKNPVAHCVMAMVGGAIVPLAEGALAHRIGLHTAFFVPVLCCLYIVFYGFIGSRQPEEEQ